VAPDLKRLATAAAIDRVRLDVGSLQARHARAATTLRDAGFRAFSQWDEDGIIQWLLARVPIEREVFVEFGVQDYREANTRFLLEHDNWRGLILDSGASHLGYLRDTELMWRHWIDARSAFITRENINELLEPVAGDIGLLSIDIDGTDYWIWEAISVVQPRLAIVEYNSIFGPDRAVTVPYEAAFDRAAAHFSRLYFGASIAALAALGSRKGYRLVGSNRAGNNAFFVRDDVAGALPALTAAEAWVESRFRESRSESGQLSYVGAHRDRLALIADLPLVDLERAATVRVGDLVG